MIILLYENYSVLRKSKVFMRFNSVSITAKTLYGFVLSIIYYANRKIAKTIRNFLEKNSNRPDLLFPNGSYLFQLLALVTIVQSDFH